MSTTFRSVIQGAAFRSDLSVLGVGPHASERVSDAEWRTLLNKSILSAWRIAATARPDFQVSSQDFVVTSGPSASFAVPSTFFDIVDVVANPDTTNEVSLGPFAWQNRRSPGGWFPPTFTTTGGASVARLMGSNVYLEPAMRAGGTYRLWYCPAPKQIRADTTVKYATAAGLPPTTSTGSGVGYFLTENANGALVIDGVTPIVGDLILVKNQTTDPSDNGIYTVTTVGTAGTPFVITRNTSFDQPAELLPLGLMAYVTAGATNVDLFFELTSTVVAVDVTAQIWVEALIEPALDQFSELLELLTAIPAMQRDDDLDPRPLIARAYGTPGSPNDQGLVGELKAYFKGTRTGNTVSKMVDTDANRWRGPWGY